MKPEELFTRSQMEEAMREQRESCFNNYKKKHPYQSILPIDEILNAPSPVLKGIVLPGVKEIIKRAYKYSSMVQSKDGFISGANYILNLINKKP